VNKLLFKEERHTPTRAQGIKGATIRQCSARVSFLGIVATSRRFSYLGSAGLRGTALKRP